MKFISWQVNRVHTIFYISCDADDRSFPNFRQVVDFLCSNVGCGETLDSIKSLLHYYRAKLCHLKSFSTYQRSLKLFICDFFPFYVTPTKLLFNALFSINLLCHSRDPKVKMYEEFYMGTDS